MRFKIVPEPPDSSIERADGDGDEAHALERAKRAIPLVPATEEECCARLLARLSLSARDAAREWLTFCRALGLVIETESGFRRSREEREFGDLATAFRERVYGVREVLRILGSAEEPLSVAVVGEEFTEHVPQWERFRYPDPEEIWGERVARILGWAVSFGLVKRVEEGYRLTDDSRR